MKVNVNRKMFDEVAISFKHSDNSSDYTRGKVIPDKASNYQIFDESAQLGKFHDHINFVRMCASQ